MSVKHTPEPWFFLEGFIQADNPEARGPDVIIAEVWPPRADDERRVATHGAYSANGLLLAAAPQMRRLLTELLALHIPHHNHPTHAAARALLREVDRED
jgi:hypothetical protein